MLQQTSTGNYDIMSQSMNQQNFDINPQTLAPTN